MKKILMVIIAILMLVSFVVACIQYKAIAAPILQGDANLDNAVNMADVIYIENVILNLAIRTPTSDVNQNNVVDMGDVVICERVIMGLHK